MQASIHPEYSEINVRCSCTNNFKIRSTLGKDLHVDVCNKCHPFYTGKQKIIDTAGQITRFNNKFGSLSLMKGKEAAEQGTEE